MPPIKTEFRGGLLFFLMLISGSGSCQWSQVGNKIYGGNVTVMTSVGEKIFAATARGVFMSDDNATTWKPTGELGRAVVRSMLAVGSTLYVSNTSESYKSIDNGVTWLPILPNYSIRKFVAVGNTIFAVSIEGVLFSMDNASTSANVLSTGLSNVSSIAVIDSTIFLSTAFSGLYSSSNLGLSWVPVNTGFTGNIGQLESVESNIIARINQAVILSTDKGITWASTGITSGIISFSKVNSKLLIGNSSKVYQSTNNGATWSTYPDLPDGFGGLATNSKGFYFGTTLGVHRSLNSGITWTESNLGITARSTSNIIGINNKIIVISELKLFKTDIDGQADWVKLNPGNFIKGNFSKIIIAGSNLVAGTFNDGVFVSSNIGDSWILANGINGAWTFAQLGDDIYAGNGYGIYVSRDLGKNWELFSNLPSVNSLGSKGVYLFATSLNGAVLRFTSDGQSVVVQSGLPTTNNQYSGFAFVGDKVYCNAPTGEIYVSTNNGDSWTKANNGLGGLSALIIKDNYLYRPKDNGVSYSLDTGISWIPFNDGFPTDIIYWGISALSLHNNRLFAGAPSSIWISCLAQEKPTITSDFTNPDSPVLTSSSTTGNRWYLDNELIVGETKQQLTASAPGTYTLDVITDGCPSPKSESEVIIFTGDLSETQPRLSIYPNPSNDRVTITLNTLDFSNPVEVEFYDVTGRSVLSTQKAEAQFQIQISDLPPGFYVVKAKQSDKKYQAKIIKR